MSAGVENKSARLPLMALAILALLAALWAGLVRIGWPFPPLIQGITAIHGGLIVSGFLGTLISMERAVALGRRWPYAAPLLIGTGSLLLLFGLSVGVLLSALGTMIFVAIFVVIVRRQPALFTITMALGVLGLLAGNLIWLAGFPIYRVVLWWTGFLVLTIVGERLELSRLMRLSRTSEILYVVSLAALLLGLVVDTVEGLALPDAGSDLGVRLAGAGMLALALWLLRYDVARRTVRQTGLTRFIALCLLAGYVWLAIGGLLRMSLGALYAGSLYDAELHTVFLGFVMSMIFGHAPIILPAVLGRAVPYRPTFYAHLALLHLSLLLRITGDLGAGLAVRQWGGMFNVLAVLLFLGATGWAIRSAPRPETRFVTRPAA